MLLLRRSVASTVVTTATRLPSGDRSKSVPPSFAIHTRGFSATNAFR